MARIILVHGTGAGTPSTDVPRWWQGSSGFVARLQRRLGPDDVVDDTFRWGNGGANSEAARRAGGLALLELLRREESRPGTAGYHLVGHSHGGSVIWHALAASLRDGGLPLQRLGSITTIGTPFLWFTPRGFLPALLTALIAAAAMAVTVPSIATLFGEFGAVMREAGPWRIAGTLVPWAVLALVCLASIVGAATFGWVAWRNRRDVHDAAEAARRYSGKWLCLWHINDEAMAGLAATMVAPPNMIPRLRRNGVFLRMLARVYDAVFARTGDALAWSILVRRLQGADVPGLALTRVACVPQGAERAWPPLPRPIMAAIGRRADQEAAVALRGIRKRVRRMARAANADAAIGMLSAAFDWDAVLHTSYFDNDDVAALIAGHIRDASSRGLGPDGASPIDRWRSAPRLLSVPVSPPHRASVRPALVNTIATGVACGGLAALFLAFHNLAVEPYTWRGQLAFIGGKVAEPEFITINLTPCVDPSTLPRCVKPDQPPRVPPAVSSLARRPAGPTMAGDILARLVVLRVVEPRRSLIEPILDGVQRSTAAERIAFALGVEGRAGELERFVREIGDIAAPDPISNYEPGAVTAVAGLAGLAGLLRAGKEPPRALVAHVVATLKTSEFYSGAPSIHELAVPVLYALKQQAELSKDALDWVTESDEPAPSCDAIARAAWNAVSMRRPDVLRAMVALCRSPERTTELLRLIIGDAIGNQIEPIADDLMKQPALAAAPSKAELFSYAVRGGRAPEARRIAQELAEDWKSRKVPLDQDNRLEIEWLKANGFGEVLQKALGDALPQARARLEEDNIHERISSFTLVVDLARDTGQTEVLNALEKQMRANVGGEYNMAVDWARIAIAKAARDGWAAVRDEVEQTAAAFSRESVEQQRYGDALDAIPVSAIPVLADAIRKMLDTARRQALSEVSLSDRPSALLRIAARYLATGDPYRARVIADLSGRAAAGYLTLLDRALADADPTALRRHSFDARNDRPPATFTILPPLPNRGG